MARLGMAIGAILLMTVLFKLLIECGFSNGVTAFSCAAVMFSLPILHFSQVFYPELMGALLTVCGFALLRAKPGIRSMLLLGLIVGLLPLFNARYWVIAGPLTLLGVFRHTMFQDKRFLAALLAPAVTVFVAIVILNFAVYGLALPNAGYIYLTRGANLGIYNSSIPAFTGDFYRGLAGIIFDQNSGLMTTAPVFILALTGFVALWKRNKRVCLQIIVVSGLYFIAVAGTRLWRGGPTPTPRFLVPIIPILALPLAAIFEDCRSTVLRIVACALIAIGTLTSLASLTSLDGDYIPTRLAARMIDAYGFSIASILPSFDHNAPETFWLTSIWILIVVGLVWWVSRTTHSREKQVPE
jgi:hypothetical protein